MKIHNVPADHIALCEKFGLKLHSSNISCATYEARMCDVSNAKDATFYLHELGHFLTADESLKLKPNYGLGSDPGGGEKTSMFCDRKKAIFEEDKALFCGALIIYFYANDLFDFHISDYNIKYWLQDVVTSHVQAYSIPKELLEKIENDGFEYSNFINACKNAKS